MGLHEDMAAAVDALYAAAIGQDTWRAAFARLVRTLNYSHASAYATNQLVKTAATAEFRLPVSGFWHGHDGAAQRDYEAEYYKHEPGRQYRLAHPNQRIYHDALYGDDRAADRSLFYDWAEREHGVRYFMLGQSDPGLPVGVIVSLHRSRRGGHPDGDELERFRYLLGHIDRAIQVETTLGGGLLPDGGSLDFLERNPAGVVILDGLGRTVAANQAARAMAADDDGLVLRGEGLSAARPADDARLQRLIGQAIGGQPGGGGTLRLARRSGRRGYVVVAAALPRRDSILANLSSTACLLITDPDAAAGCDEELLRAAYGLTRGEARLAGRLAAGESLAQAALALDISVGTARGYLATVFRKTETGRQQDLVRLVASLPWWAATTSGPRRR